MHRHAIGFPDCDYEYVGVNQTDDLDGAEKGEAQAKSDFGADPYGLDTRPRFKKPPDDKKPDPRLGTKREERNPFLRNNSSKVTCLRLKGLFQHVECCRSNELPADDTQEASYEMGHLGWPPERSG